MLKLLAPWAQGSLGMKSVFRRLKKVAFKEIFESEDTLFRKKIGFTFKEDISKRRLNEVEKTLAQELGG